MSRFRTLAVSAAALSPERLHFVTVKSEALGQRADLTLHVPAEVEGWRDVPLVILLHGIHASHWAWAFTGGAHRTAARLIAAGEIPPLVLAMPSDGLWGDGSGYVRHAAQDFERWIVDEVPAAAREACAAVGVASPLCIAGLSMGGFGALRLAARYPQRFVAAAGHSSITDASQLDPLLAESRAGWAGADVDRSLLAALRAAPGPLPRLRFDCGLADGLLGANRELHAALDAAGIAHEYAEHAGGHAWTYWSDHLEDTLRFFAAALKGGETAR